jgi:hypothetical protein
MKGQHYSSLQKVLLELSVFVSHFWIHALVITMIQHCILMNEFIILVLSVYKYWGYIMNSLGLQQQLGLDKSCIIYMLLCCE